MNDNKELRSQLIDLQLRGLLAHLENGHLTLHDRASAARATSSLITAARLENGEAVDISVVREATSLEDSLAMLTEENSSSVEA